MKFTLEIKMDNAAFKDIEDSEMANAYAGGEEVARILRELSDKVRDRGLTEGNSGVALDYNGNRVGTWSVTS